MKYKIIEKYKKIKYKYCSEASDTLTWRDPCRFPGLPSAPRIWTARYHIWNEVRIMMMMRMKIIIMMMVAMIILMKAGRRIVMIISKTYRPTL